MVVSNHCKQGATRLILFALLLNTVFLFVAAIGSGGDGSVGLPIPSPIPDPNGPIVSPPDSLGDTINPVMSS